MTIRRACYLIAAPLFASGLAHLVVQAVVGGPWDGPVSWRKPADFGVAFGLTLWAVTWGSTYLKVRPAVLAGFAAASVVEVVVISVQAWRGVPSHFNTTTPLNAAFAFSAAAGGAVIIVTTLFLLRAAFRPLAAPPGMQLALRVGFASLLVGLAVGAVMIAIGTTTARTVSLDAAYTAAVVLVPAHAAAMQGIVALPILAWLTRFTPWPDSRRHRVTALGTAGYLVCAATIVLESFVGINAFDLTTAPVAGSAVAAAGALVLVGAGITVLWSCQRRLPARSHVR
ncbi:hypothetical protein [Kutzneria sp. CA-103260]|uniref:hypothetical protein n=1 Tax=Kutzneria sp. CA-103260 TaxID=2802641 RepID=UPI001BA729DC|nr:hypothetical protein [Kutzneria sp. CA-103260]QUQ65191.1 hypothetical protein JJ691_29120 [Kutzneria sp. CA-103260]